MLRNSATFAFDISSARRVFGRRRDSRGSANVWLLPASLTPAADTAESGQLYCPQVALALHAIFALDTVRRVRGSVKSTYNATVVKTCTSTVGGVTAVVTVTSTLPLPLQPLAVDKGTHTHTNTAWTWKKFVPGSGLTRRSRDTERDQTIYGRKHTK